MKIPLKIVGTIIIFLVALAIYIVIASKSQGGSMASLDIINGLIRGA